MRKNQIDPKLLRHWNLLDRFQKQLAKSIKKSTVSATELDPLRTLTSFNYFSLFLFGLFNPVINPMRVRRLNST